MRRRLVTLASAIAVLGALVGAAPAAAVPCSGVQAALDAAPDNGTVVVDEGTCTNMSLTLKSRPTTALVTLEGAGDGATFDGGNPSSAFKRILTGEDVGGIRLRNLTFKRSTGSGNDDGGAVKITGHSRVIFERLTFMENSAVGYAGGGAYIQSISDMPIEIRDSLFGDPYYTAGNRALNGGGLAIAEGPGGADVQIENSHFDGNQADGSGGGLWVSNYELGGKVSMVDSTANDNGAAVNGGGAMIVAQNVTLKRNVFATNGVGNVTTGPHAGGGLFVARSVGSGFLDQEQNRFQRNLVAGKGRVGGGGEWIRGMDTTSVDDRFAFNELEWPPHDGSSRATGAGFGIERCSDTATLRAVNLVVAANRMAWANGRGAGVYVGRCQQGSVNATFLNSTIAGNHADGGAATAGLLGADNAGLTLRNSIVAGNTGSIDLKGFERRSVAYSDACAPGVVPGAGNICADPLLVDPGSEAYADVHQTQLSPTIDRGCNCFVESGPPLAHYFDFEGDKRVRHTVDMGADEFAAVWPLAAHVSSVGRFGATLQVDDPPNVCFANVRFQYGETRAYGRVTPRVGYDTRCRPLPLHVTGLRPGRTYHFRLVATNSRGTTVGIDQTFTTRP